MEGLVESILKTMSSVKRPQMQFIITLLNTLCVVHGKATFRNMSRYCHYCEKTFSRWFRRTFDFATLNSELIRHELQETQEKIAAIDASFMSKSGRCTEGLGWFYRGSTGQAERGLEMSSICIIDLQANTAYSLDNQQTIDLPQEADGSKEETRVDQYAQQFVKMSDHLRTHDIRYLVADNYYSKVKFVNTVLKQGFHLVGKLRHDANLKWLYEGEYSGLGAPKKYDGKVKLSDGVDRFDFEGEEDSVKVYSKIVWSVNFKRQIKVVILQWDKKGKVGTALLYTTDLQLAALKVVEYYKARFQIEFLFRDAKQYTGLLDCQSTRKEAIHTQINASMTALNLMKFEDRRLKKTNDKTVISIASWKRKKMNFNIISRVLDKLGIQQTCEKAKSLFEDLGHYGAIAA